jgi:hypothetical protein
MCDSDGKGKEQPANVKAKRLPEKGLLENALA